MLIMRCWKFISYFSTLILCAGCYGYYHLNVSRPEAQHSPIKIDSNGVVSLNDVRLALRPSNRVEISYGAVVVGVKSDTSIEPNRKSAYYPGDLRRGPLDYFYVELMLETHLSDVKLLPDQIFLIKKNGERVAPASYLAPLEAYGKYNYGLDLCKPNLEKIRSLQGTILLPPNVQNCLAIRYNTSFIPPEEAFSIEVQGLTIDGVRVVVPKINFSFAEFDLAHN